MAAQPSLRHGDRSYRLEMVDSTEIGSPKRLVLRRSHGTNALYTPGHSPMKPKHTAPIDFSGPQVFVTITVGKEKHVNTVHKSLICRYSEFFRCAFKSAAFIEGETKTMTFDDIEHDIFCILVNWLYHQDLHHSDGRPILQIEYCKLWVLAERFLMPCLQNDAMKGFIADPDWWTSDPYETHEEIADGMAEVFRFVFNGPNTSPLKHACLQILMMEWNGTPKPRSDTEQLYKTLLGEGMGLDMVLALSRLGIDYLAEARGFRLEDYLVPIDGAGGQSKSFEDDEEVKKKKATFKAHHSRHAAPGYPAFPSSEELTRG